MGSPGAPEDIALDPAIAEIAALMRALVADREDLVAAPVEDHVLAVHRDEGRGEEREGGDVEDLGLHRARYASSSSSTMWSTRTGRAPPSRPCWIWMMQPGLAVTTASAPVARMFSTLRR